MTNHRQVILASASPRRKELLSELKLDYIVVPSKVDEEQLIDEAGNISPASIAELLAAAKAQDVFKSVDVTSVVIGADTIVVLDDDILGKPSDFDDSVAMLQRLSGRTHTVYTGVAVVAAGTMETGSAATTVTFKTLSLEEIRAYVETGEPMDKAGSYGIQNADISPVAKIDGDYYNVVGLPLARLRDMLISFFPGLPSAPQQPPQFR